MFGKGSGNGITHLDLERRFVSRDLCQRITCIISSEYNFGDGVSYLRLSPLELRLRLLPLAFLLLFLLDRLRSESESEEYRVISKNVNVRLNNVRD